MATPLGLQQTPLITLDLSDNQINFVDNVYEGHRVRVTLNTETANRFFRWRRSFGDSNPTGQVTDLSNLKIMIADSLTHTFTDLDGVSAGLNLSSSALVNASNKTNTINDLIMCYLLYKVQGSSNFDTANKVISMTGALSLITNDIVAEAVRVSFSDNNDVGEAIDLMFQALRSANPMHFFDSSGVQVRGIFETSTDISGEGSWRLIQGDVIQIKLAFHFRKAVTRRMVSQTSSSMLQETMIDADTILPIRLQIILSDSAIAPTFPEPQVTQTLQISGGVLSSVTGNPTSVVISNTVTTIATTAFSDMASLVSVTIPSSVTTIEDYAFKQTSLTTVTIPNSVTSLGNTTFQGVSTLTSVTFGSGLTSIGNSTFKGTSLTSLDLSQTNITSIGAQAFRNNTTLTSVILPSGITYFGADAFQNTGIISIEFPSTINSQYSFTDNAFYTTAPLQQIIFNNTDGPVSFDTDFLSSFNADSNTQIIVHDTSGVYDSQWQANLGDQVGVTVQFI